MKPCPIFWILTMFLALMGAAHASDYPGLTDEEERIFSVKIPQSQFSLPTDTEMKQASDEGSFFSNGQLEVSASSWAPRGIRTPSYFEATTFRATGAPELSLGFYTAPYIVNRWLWLSYHLGASYLNLSRSGTAVFAAVPETVNQNLYLIPFDLGAQLCPANLKWEVFQPYLGASLLPSLILTPRSPLESGTSTLAMPVELGAGALVGLPWLSQAFGFPSINADLGAILTLGLAGSSDLGDFSGAGFQGGLRISL